ncbi:MAG: M24 family metallopeptidase [Acidimicrobiales bacterium]
MRPDSDQALSPDDGDSTGTPGHKGGAGVGNSSGWGTAVLEEGDRVAFGQIRAEHHRALFGAMEANGFDALVLGRESSIRYASGARRFWTEGVRPFGPGCVVIADTGRVHLLSTWDDGVPQEITGEQLYGLTWNGAVLATELSGIEGLAGARRIGVDAMTPGAARLFSAVMPDATLVDASGVLMELRRIKTPDELASIMTALAVAEAALSSALFHLEPGIPARSLTGIVAERMAGLGVTNPDLEARFSLSGPTESSRGTLPSDALVRCEVGTLFAGYQGTITRTWVNTGDDGRPVPATSARKRLARRWTELFERLLGACGTGGDGRDLLSAYAEAGEPLPPGPVAHGVGLGMEPPLVGGAFPQDAGATTPFEPNMVLFVTGVVSDPDGSTVEAGQCVRISESGPEVLTRHSLGPLFDPVDP